MKRLALITTLLAAGALAFAAQQTQPQPRAFGDKDGDGICDVTGKPVGQGRAARAQGQTPPFAFGDKDNDGICDATGKPVGQGRAMRQGRNGRAAGRGHCRRSGRGMRGKGRRGGPAPPAGDAQTPKPEAPAEKSE